MNATLTSITFRSRRGGGTISLQVDPLGERPNLDAFVAIYDSDGDVVDFDIPQDEVAASIDNLDVAAGTYYVRVEGVGSHDSFDSTTGNVVEPSPQPWNSSTPEGYSDYGSLGQYRVSGTIIAPTSNLFSIVATDAEKVEGSSGSTPLTFTVTRSGDTSQASSVDYALIATLPRFVGDNYEDQADSVDFATGSSLSGTLNFSADETTKSLTFNIRGDNIVEETSTLIFFCRINRQDGNLLTVVQRESSSQTKAVSASTALEHRIPFSKVLSTAH